MSAQGKKNGSPSYSVWLDKPVVMFVLIRQCHVPMICRILGESAADVRVRIQPGWEMDVRKDWIISVEDVAAAAPVWRTPGTTNRSDRLYPGRLDSGGRHV